MYSSKGEFSYNEALKTFPEGLINYILGLFDKPNYAELESINNINLVKRLKERENCIKLIIALKGSGIEKLKNYLSIRNEYIKNIYYEKLDAYNQESKNILNTLNIRTSLKDNQTIPFILGGKRTTQKLRKIKKPRRSKNYRRRHKHRRSHRRKKIKIKHNTKKNKT